jgi:hypothetical protein
VRSDTPILDAAIRAGCKALDTTIGITEDCRHPSCGCNKKALIVAALHAALPWDLPEERLEAMARAYNGTSRWLTFNAGEEEREKAIFLVVYRANPIMRELYPERFNVAA